MNKYSEETDRQPSLKTKISYVDRSPHSAIQERCAMSIPALEFLHLEKLTSSQQTVRSTHSNRNNSFDSTYLVALTVKLNLMQSFLI